MTHAMARTELLTARLRLRWFTEDDAGLMLSIWNDPDFIRHVADRGIRSEADAAQALRDGILKLYADFGYGPYRVESREEGVPMGICGLFKRDNLDFPDIGYTLLPDFRSQGYALEAAHAVLAHARDVLACAKVYAIVSPGNAPSRRLLEQLGMEVVGALRMPGDEEDVMLHAIEFTTKRPDGAGR
jgi:RimJ/RimL family protein N-acetyltransferase